MDCMSMLAAECLIEIIHRTSPADASRIAVMSKELKSAADSDAVWDGFLPSDLPEIASRSVSPPVVHATKKGLYSSLFRSPVLIDAGELSFSLEKKSGKKCFMVGAKALGIIWCHNTAWDYTPLPDSRFSEVAVLKTVFWLEIHGTINTQLLSSNTIYGAYLVFKLKEGVSRIVSANAFVRFVNDTVEKGKDERAIILNHFSMENSRARGRRTGEVPVKIGDGLTEIAPVHLKLEGSHQQQEQTGRFAVQRGDGWMEVEMGSFDNGHGGGGVVEAWLLEADNYRSKSGLIVEGIEFRPKL